MDSQGLRDLTFKHLGLITDPISTIPFILENPLSKGMACFETAISKDPLNAKLFYAQGMSLFEWGSYQEDPKTLKLACRKFKEAVTLSPGLLQGWQAWGSVLLALGLVTLESHYFLDAKIQFDKALKLATDTSYEDLPELYSDYGIVLRELGKRSEEPADLYQALAFFEKALQLNALMPAEFWQDYGITCLYLSRYATGQIFVHKAIDSFQKALSLNAKLLHGWILLGESFKKLYFLTHERDHLEQAISSFQAALVDTPNDSVISLSWTRLLLDSLYEDFDFKRLEMCALECERIYQIFPHDPLVQARVCEVSCFLGKEKEDPQMLVKASLELEAITCDTPALLLSYGLSLKSCYEYFEDVDYLYQAIEKFQEALSLDRTSAIHWHEMGSTYSLLGELHEDKEELELGVRFLRKALFLQFDLRSIAALATCLFHLGHLTHSEEHLREAAFLFTSLFDFQKSLIDIHPEWVYDYAATLDALNDFEDSEEFYLKAIELLSHLLMTHPDFYEAHHLLALIFFHFSEYTETKHPLLKALSHYRMAFKHDSDNDGILVDWGIALLHLAEYTLDAEERSLLYRDAEHKLLNAAKLGNCESYYPLSTLYSLTENLERALLFLRKAHASETLPAIDDVLEDDKLYHVRLTPEFQKFLLHFDLET